MSKGRSLRRLWRHRSYVVVAAALLLAAGITSVGVTFASFTADTQNNTSTVPDGWIGPATNATVTPSGYDGQVNWTAGGHGTTGEQVYGLDQGATQSCPATGYSLLPSGTLASATSSTYTQSISNPMTTLSAAITSTTATSITVTSSTGFPATPFTIQIDDEQLTVTNVAGTTWTVTRGANSTTAATHLTAAGLWLVSSGADPDAGHYRCYQIVSTSSSNWTGVTTLGAQLGLVVTGVTITNGTSGKLSTGDTIKVTYNQQPTLVTTGLTAGVCESWTAAGAVTIYVYYSTCAAQPSNPGYQLKITGLVNGQASANKGSATISAPTVSTSAPWTVTYTLTQSITQGMTAATGTAVPGGSWVKSAATTDQAPACMSATYHCTASAQLH